MLGAFELGRRPEPELEYAPRPKLGDVRRELTQLSATLEAGDSCTCYADAVHRFDNSGGKIEALIYVVVEQP